MEQNFRGLAEEQQNDCRAALQTFIERHGLSQWGMDVTVQEKAPGNYSVKIEITPPPKLGLTRYLDLQEIAIAGPSFNVAAEVDKMLELAYQTHFTERKV